ncbi:MAG: cardiolipin synthase B [Blastocatellia bacterium]|nr:MAG: cardiolipin synthase B [Blastocatellia bacterium]
MSNVESRGTEPTVLYLTIIGAAFIAWLLLVLLFTPAISYHIERPVDARTQHFVNVLESTCQTTLKHGNKIEVLTNGTTFYPAMLDAIANASETINMECYIFKKGEVADRFVAALRERAQHGVQVTVVLDAIGSFGTFHRSAAPLREAGCRVESYRRLAWYSLARLNNRTHRELLVVDGRIAFLGGAGVADWWATRNHRKSRKGIWRDTMARIEGPVVSDIQGVLAENWLECCGEILTDPITYKPLERMGGSAAFVIKSSPADRATSSRVLFQTLVEGATGKVLISTPYFLPDKALRRALCRTAKRGVRIMVIVPGRDTDQRWVRLASRRMFGRLLHDGVRIFEYEGGMTHVKALIVDDLWSIIGTTNVDNRSFEYNDEVNLAVRDETVAERLTADFDEDLARSSEVVAAKWRRRPILEKLIGTVAWVLERQQ